MPPNVHERIALPPDAVARFRRDLAVCGVDPARETWLVAVSGGADSLALLLLSHAVLGTRCVAATVDHGLRPTSRDEATAVAALCARLGIGHAVLAAPLPPRAGRTANLSARARLLRYRLLEAHRAACGARWLATAHHADDRVETLVMRLNRGAGLAGLAGIRRTAPGLVRPLLDWRRDDLAALVAGAGIGAADDPTNRDDRFDRARLRKVLRGADWLDAERIGRSVDALADAEAALAWTTRSLLADRLEGDRDALLLDTRDLPAELRRRLGLAALAMVDPSAAPAGPALARLISALEAGRPATLGQVLATPAADGRWRFAPAPPRRSG